MPGKRRNDSISQIKRSSTCVLEPVTIVATASHILDLATRANHLAGLNGVKHLKSQRKLAKHDERWTCTGRYVNFHLDR